MRIKRLREGLLLIFALAPLLSLLLGLLLLGPGIGALALPLAVLGLGIFLGTQLGQERIESGQIYSS